MADLTTSANVDAIMAAADYAAIRDLLNVAYTDMVLTSGEATTAGQQGYVKSDGKIWLTDADAAATSGPVLTGVILTTTSGADEACTLQIGGTYTTTGLTAGSAYYISTTAGARTTTAPSAVGDIVRIIGYATSTTEFVISSDQTYIEIGDGTGDPVELVIACSDETTDLTTGTAKVTFRMPFAMTLSDVRSNVNTAPVGSTLVVDINEGGTTILSTKLSIDASEKTSTTAATAPVISDSALADDAEMTIDIDQIGSSTAGKGLKVTLIGTRA